MKVRFDALDKYFLTSMNARMKEYFGLFEKNINDIFY